jgi:hypothetical protein
VRRIRRTVGLGSRFIISNLALLEETMRITRLLFAPALLLAAAVGAHAQPTRLAEHRLRDTQAVLASQMSPAAAVPLVLRPPVQLPAVRAVTSADRRTPTSRQHRAPLEMVALAVIGATKRTSRRKAGKKRDVPMYLDSDAHVLRENDEGRMVTTVIKGDQLVDDTDLTDEEIEELTARRVIRPATVPEIDRLEAADTASERAELVRSQQTEIAQLTANNDAERADFATRENTSPDALAKLDQKHAASVAALQEKQAGALAKFDAKATS